LTSTVQSISGGPYKIKYKETVTVINFSGAMISLNACSKNSTGQQGVIRKTTTAASNGYNNNKTKELRLPWPYR